VSLPLLTRDQVVLPTDGSGIGAQLDLTWLRSVFYFQVLLGSWPAAFHWAAVIPDGPHR